jgi:RimJ/RimL family protein N-acetyltransferase
MLLSEITIQLSAWKASPEALRLPFSNTSGEQLGHLICVGKEDWLDEELAQKIAEWRERDKLAFATRFIPDVAKTKGYLQHVAFAGKDRILFRLTDMDDMLVGHIGLANINNSTADLDNLMLGNRDKGLEFIHAAEIELLHFCFDVLGVERVAADVLSTNLGAQLLHRSIGFKATVQTPLDSKIDGSGTEVLSPAQDVAAPTSDINNIRFELEMLKFHKRFPPNPANR